MNAPEFNNSYARLPDRFYTKLDPTPVTGPSRVAVNDALAGEIGIDPAWLASDAGLAMLSGNAMPMGAEPLAQVYAGHQFGGWSPQLGDGRAHLLGEVGGFDVALKGSGPTPYSRMGDGRAWLGPVLREYVVSEAMAALGVPTTRALAAVRTGDDVLREAVMPGAVLTRVARSHLRVGTFQYFAAQGDVDALRDVLAYGVARHYPDLARDDALGFLQAVTQAQAELIAKWMGLGFIHGVMNTDNCHIGGLTIDYGPCAFMDGYDPGTVFSSIDQFGRYAYQAQPEIVVWNLAQLASALLPLIDGDQDKAVAAAQDVLRGFGALYTRAWGDVFFAKIGLADGRADDVALVQDLLARMAATKADFTLTFRALSQDWQRARGQFADPASFDDWAVAWQARGPSRDMTRANPAFIARNHRVEDAIRAAVAGDDAPFHRLNTVLSRPYDDQPDHAELMAAPKEGEVLRATFCGT